MEFLNNSINWFLYYFRSGESTRKRLKRIPTINFNATHWTQLIDLTLCGIFEPPMTDFSESKLRESLLNGIKLDLPDLPPHSQAMERAVKLTTEASQTVYGFEARHQYIPAKVLSQKLWSAFLSKGSYMEQFNSIY